MTIGPDSINPKKRLSYAITQTALAQESAKDEDFARAYEAALKLDRHRVKESGLLGRLINAALADTATRIITDIGTKFIKSDERDYELDFGNGTCVYSSMCGSDPEDRNSQLIRFGRSVTRNTGEKIVASTLIVTSVESQMVIPTLDEDPRFVDELAVRRIEAGTRHELAKYVTWAAQDHQPAAAPIP